jgi:hypothetical protein
MDSADPGTLLPSGPATALRTLPGNIARVEAQREPLYLALRLGGDTACVWSNRCAPVSAVPGGDRFLLPSARDEPIEHAREPSHHGRHTVADTGETDGVLPGDFGKHRGYGRPCDTTRPGGLESCIYDLADGSEQCETEGDTGGTSSATRNRARSGIAPAATTSQSSTAWKLRRNNSDGSGIPVAWYRGGAHNGLHEIQQGGAGTREVYATVLELQLIHGDGSEQLSLREVQGIRVLGYLYADTAEEAGDCGREETGTAFEEGPQEQTSIGIPSVQLQYWLASQPEPWSEGLNVLLELLPGVYRHLVQSESGILPGFRYWFLKCDRFECLVGDCSDDDLALEEQGGHLRRLETVRFLTWLGLDARRYTLHITPQEFRNPPDPWRDWRAPSPTGLDMSWYPR